MMKTGDGNGVANGLDRGRGDVVVDRGGVNFVVDDFDRGRPRQYDK